MVTEDEHWKDRMSPQVKFQVSADDTELNVVI